MVNGITNNLSLGRTLGGGAVPGNSSAGVAGTPEGKSFSDVLKNSIDEVSKLQNDASKAVEDVASGKSEDITGVMTAMEKSDLAFKTLLAIRAKLMEAYDEVKQMQM
jgi:flagellar hook-basal body complex protein FliE